jgi:hypothetical protein
MRPCATSVCGLTLIHSPDCLSTAAGSLPTAAGALPTAAGSLSTAAGSLPTAAGALPTAAGARVWHERWRQFLYFFSSKASKRQFFYFCTSKASKLGTDLP